MRAMVFLAGLVVGARATEFSLHGSGTTNPSRLFWTIMDLLAERTKIDVHMTYRAVGSSIGQKEFLGASNGDMALNDFGSGDIPMTASRYASIVAANRTMMHIPFAREARWVPNSCPSPAPLSA
jgi:ABC-type phosphate transport system substrate-binding protein